jgi:hypothetical protein
MGILRGAVMLGNVIKAHREAQTAPDVKTHPEGLAVSF